jgi:putative ABC transport system substrate-binding protein
VRRRDFISGLGSAAGWPLTARAQQPNKVWRLGMIAGGSRERIREFVEAFPEGMRELGYFEGRDYVADWRFADGQYERISGFASELIRAKVDVFVLFTAAAIRPVQQATATIPIVMTYSTDPVGNGFVASLARPGGNTTGLASSSDDTAPKQIELLTTIVPQLSRLGFLYNSGNPNSTTVLKSAVGAAESARVQVISVNARNVSEIEAAFGVFGRENVDALMVGADATFLLERHKLANVALQNRLPSMFVQREFVEAGGLMSYGENLKDFLRRSAVFVDKIIKGAKPSDLPIEQPTMFKLTINRKTAEALGLKIPSQLYIIADELIE